MPGLRWIYIFLLSVNLSHPANNWKSLNREIKRKYYGPTKHSQEKNSKFSGKKNCNPGNTHEKKFRTHEMPIKTRYYDGTRPTKPTMSCNAQNLAHSEAVTIIHFAVSFNTLRSPKKNLCWSSFCCSVNIAKIFWY